MDSVYPGYGDNPYNPEDTVAIQPIPSRYIRYIADTEDTLSLGSRSYPLDLHRILWIFWIPIVSSGFSGFPIYRSDPHRIPDMRIWKGFSDPEYGGDPEDTSRIQRIRGSAFSPCETVIKYNIGDRVHNDCSKRRSF